MYFPGDTDLFEEMEALDAIDVALLPIGGWGESVGEGHLDPRRAVRATELVQPRLVVPIHWGTYSPIRVPHRPPRWLGDPVARFESEMGRAGAADRLAGAAARRRDGPGAVLRGRRRRPSSTLPIDPA